MKHELNTGTSSNIVRTLAANKIPMSLSEIKKKLNIDWNTARTNLMKLERSGRVHIRFIGGNRYYILNGKSKFADDIQMSDNEHLWLDIFEPNTELKEHFIRIKQTIRKDINRWEAVGSITIKKKKIKELMEKLEKLNKTLEKEYL